jgi:hypothetical protein
MTEPAVGASQWASGSHMWKGINGILTANERKKANQHNLSTVGSNSKVLNTKKLVEPVFRNMNNKHMNITIELTKVYKNNRYDALIFLCLEPYNPIMKYIGINIASNNT